MNSLSRRPNICGMTKKRHPNRSGRRATSVLQWVWVDIYFAYCMFFFYLPIRTNVYFGSVRMCVGVKPASQISFIEFAVPFFYFFHIKNFHLKMGGSKIDDKKCESICWTAPLRNASVFWKLTRFTRFPFV